MPQGSEAFRYEFQPGIPLEAAAPGTNLLVSSPSGVLARELALDLLAAGSGQESLLLVAADLDGRGLLDRLDRPARSVDRSRLGIVDCTGPGDRDEERFTTHGEPISNPGDLTSIEVEFSLLYEKIAAEASHVRIGLLSLSSLLAHASLREVSRFVHMLTGRIIATDDLGVFAVDASLTDERTVETLSHFCDRHVQVRNGGDGGVELRVDERMAEPGAWAPLDHAVGGEDWDASVK
ncbi:DUF7504 family protein [Haloglomus litoreum]|uniref:DUF7504 family protein n=1 Tax=Haloglomus litoreum TaxID=3034026 RepID=UPI0023E8F5DC|nr:hypothetical protein [Haloglomus sp. DT116]